MVDVCAHACLRKALQPITNAKLLHVGGSGYAALLTFSMLATSAWLTGEHLQTPAACWSAPPKRFDSFATTAH